VKRHKLAFVDLETSGLDPFKHEILEIGIVIAEQRADLFGKQYLEILSEHEILLLPEHIETAEAKALEISKYFKRDRSKAVPQREGLAQAAAILEGTIFVAQNVAFDWAFLQKAGNEYGVNLEKAVYYHKLDLASMALGKHYHLPELSKFTLRELTTHFAVVNQDAHTALADARATFEVCKKLLASLTVEAKCHI
jgi:DNA polymerase III alpha subunit (gram-positive type)